MTTPRQRVTIGTGPPLRLSRADADAGTPLYRQVYLQLRARIESRYLRPGERLPSARDLVRDLRVSRNTIEGGLGLLVAEGWIVRRVGSGSVVAARGTE
jgi:GntR family transcriptional regulator/MocR family aminotransferase